MHNRTLTLLVTSLGLLTLAGPARADDVTSGHSELEQMESPTVDQKFQLSSGFTYLSDADFDNSALGDVNTWRWDVRGGYTLVTPHGDLGLGAFYEYSQYELGNLPDDYDDFDFNVLAFDGYWKGMFNETWGY